MIRRVQVRNFRSLRDMNLDLRDRNILIGPNKSGKSSILDAFRFLAQAIAWGDVARAIDERGGFPQLVWKGPKGLTDALRSFLEEIDFELEGSLPSPVEAKFRYRLAVSGDAAGRVAIKRELLEFVLGEETRTLISLNDGEGVANRLDGTRLFSNPSDRKKPALSYDVPGWEASALRTAIDQWHYYDLIPQAAKTAANTAAAVGVLDLHGGNLSSWIHTLQVNHPDEFERIARLFSDAFPEVESLGTLVTQAGTTFLTLRESVLQSPVPIFAASSGELKFLMLLSLMYSPFGAPLYLIEEPENHLHPRLLERVVEIANQRRRDLLEKSRIVSQVIATTHSPYLVDLLDPEDIIVVTKHDGQTTCTRPGSGEELLRVLREAETTLGRLWFSGALGGV